MMKIREGLFPKKGIQKYHKRMRTLEAILVFGLIAHSIILLIINKSINPEELMGIWNEGTMHMRLCWRQCAEIMLAVSCFVYCVGHVIVLWKSVKKREKISFRDGLSLTAEPEKQKLHIEHICRAAESFYTIFEDSNEITITSFTKSATHFIETLCSFAHE